MAETDLDLQDDDGFDEILVDHAVRCWDAERENANRLSARSTLLLTALAALFGDWVCFVLIGFEGRRMSAAFRPVGWYGR